MKYTAMLMLLFSTQLSAEVSFIDSEFKLDREARKILWDNGIPKLYKLCMSKTNAKSYKITAEAIKVNIDENSETKNINDVASIVMLAGSCMIIRASTITVDPMDTQGGGTISMILSDSVSP